MDRKKENYCYIAWIIGTSFLICSTTLLIYNSHLVTGFVVEHFGERKALLIQLFFWAALGSTIACSLFMKKDHEVNETECLKTNPDPQVLQYPDAYDIQFYVHRLFTSGILGVVGGVIIFAGLGYFDLPLNNLTAKHKYFFIVISFLIGMYQGDFVTYLNELTRKLLRKADTDAPKSTS